jgi:uncharacterized glyoxalase superfamily protein PhnB
MSSTLIPCLRYEDAPKMIEWLCNTFGFERHLVVDDGDGGIAHAQLTLGDGMIMLGSARDDEFGKLQTTPKSVGTTTQSPYMVVPDPDAVYARAKAEGAEIIREVRDEDYGGRGFSCRDPEGHIWSVGSYDPWAPLP